MAQTPDKLDMCDAVRPQLALYAAEQLDASEAQQIKEHVASCSACAQEVAFARVLSVSAPRLPLASPPADLFDKIALATYAAPPRRTLRETLLGWVAPAPTRLALGTAFAIGIAALVVLPRLPEKGGVSVPPAPSQPITSHTQHKPMAPAPTQAVAPPVLPTLPNRAEKAEKVVAKNSVKATAPSGRTKDPVEATVLPAPTAIDPVGAETPVATTSSTTFKSQTTPKTTVKQVNIAAHKTAAPLPPIHAARPAETLGHTKTIVATNPPPSATHEGDDITNDNGTAPDMEHMKQVAMADPSEMRKMAPTTTSGAAEEASGSKVPKGFTLRGANTGNTSQFGLSSRSARDLGIPTPNVSIVQAPAKID